MDSKGRLAQLGCLIWGVAGLATLLLTGGILVYIDQRFGEETSAFFLGLLMGLPFLLVVVVVVGGIYVLVIRGTGHLQRQDDLGEIARMEALQALARSERSYAQTDKATIDMERQRLKLLEEWRKQQGAPPGGWQQLPKWDEDRPPNPSAGGDDEWTILD